MNQQQFMADFFPENSTVTIDANELQQLIRDKHKLEGSIEANDNTIHCLKNVINTLKAKNTMLELEKPITVKLDIKG